MAAFDCPSRCLKVVVNWCLKTTYVLYVQMSVELGRWGSSELENVRVGGGEKGTP